MMLSGWLTRIARIGLLLLAAADVVAAGEKVRLALPNTGLAMLPVYLAQGLGLYAEEGLEVERIVTQGGGLELRALSAGQVEFAFTSGDAVLIGLQNGHRLVMVYSGLHRPIFNWAMHKEAARQRGITDGSPVDHKLRALNGLTLGLSQLGALPQHLAEYAIRKAGLTPHKDVRFAALGAGSMWLAGLESRKVDVAVTAVPLPEMAAQNGRTILFINNARGEDPSLSEFLMGNLVVRPDYLRRNPETVRKVVRAMFQANRFALTNPPEKTAEILQPFLAQTEAKALLEGVKATLPALNPDGYTSERAVIVTNEVLEQAGLLTKPAPFADIVNNEWVPVQRGLSPWSH
jgi:NitT/TauT family transport system substrate-binding protein